jgi:hypothetical protein
VRYRVTGMGAAHIIATPVSLTQLERAKDPAAELGKPLSSDEQHIAAGGGPGVLVDPPPPYTVRPGLARILELAVNVVKGMKKPYRDLPEHEQKRLIHELDEALEHEVRAMIEEIAARRFPHVVAMLESLQVKDGLKAVATIPAEHPSRHALMDHVRSSIVLVMVNPEIWLEGERPKPEPDQPALPLGAGNVQSEAAQS